MSAISAWAYKGANTLLDPRCLCIDEAKERRRSWNAFQKRARKPSHAGEHDVGVQSTLRVFNAPSLAHTCGDVALSYLDGFAQRMFFSEKEHQERVTDKGLSPTLFWVTTIGCALTLFALSSKVVLSRFDRIQLSVWTHLRLQKEPVPKSYFVRQTVYSTFQATFQNVPMETGVLSSRTTHWESRRR